MPKKGSFIPNEYIEYDDRIEIKLTKKTGKIYWCIIDKEDYEKVKQYRWCHLNPFYVFAKGVINNELTTFKIHSLILEEYKSIKESTPDKTIVVDHINRNGLDNRKCNLRICEQYVNCQNQLRKKTLGIYHGVRFDKRLQKWVARIGHKRRIRYTLGHYKDLIDAVIAYDVAAIKLYGNDAYLNFPFMVGYEESEIPDFIIDNVNIALTNSRKSKCISRYKGVCFVKRNQKKWTGIIDVNRERFYLGSYYTEEEAAKAYDNFIINNNLNRKINNV